MAAAVAAEASRLSTQAGASPLVVAELATSGMQEKVLMFKLNGKDVLAGVEP